jgi:hypothetical protein
MYCDFICSLCKAHSCPAHSSFFEEIGKHTLHDYTKYSRGRLQTEEITI